MEYRIPTGEGFYELVEKRSRFLGHVWQVESEEEARAHIEAAKKKYHDARHNCWCYRIQEGGIERYSDDGEPQGTAGQPMLNVFQREGIANVCCVVTRYFGGILLGAGGLVRAYTQGAKGALDAAGISQVRPWAQLALEIPYPLFERVKLEAESLGGIIEDVEYAQAVTLYLLFPVEAQRAFGQRITELSAGTCAPELLDEVFRGAPLIAPKM